MCLGKMYGWNIRVSRNLFPLIDWETCGEHGMFMTCCPIRNSSKIDLPMNWNHATKQNQFSKPNVLDVLIVMWFFIWRLWWLNNYNRTIIFQTRSLIVCHLVNAWKKEWASRPFPRVCWGPCHDVPFCFVPSRSCYSFMHCPLDFVDVLIQVGDNL